MSNKGSEATVLPPFNFGLVMGKSCCHNIISSSFTGEDTGLP